MNTILEALWNGNIKPYFDYDAGDDEIKELKSYLNRHGQDLEQLLDKEQKLVFDKVLVCGEEYIYLSKVLAFEEGFVLAVKLMTAALHAR